MAHTESASVESYPSLPNPPHEQSLSDASIRVVCPAVMHGDIELERFTTGFNRVNGELIDTIKRWWDGGYGAAPGEDPALGEKMQSFIAVAMEEFPAKFIVRFMQHLMEGTCWHSVAGSLRFADTAKVAKALSEGQPPPKTQPRLYEKAEEAGDTEKLARFDHYLEIARLCRDGVIRPLHHQIAMRDRMGSDLYAELVLMEVAQALKSHVKLQKTWEVNEENRLKELKKFLSSKDGEAYVAVREREFSTGIPRNRKARHEIFARPGCVTWRKPDATLAPASTLRELFERNPELKALRNTHTLYEQLSKPFTEPRWTPISETNPRWPFLPVKFFSEPLRWNGTRFEIGVRLPDFEDSGAPKNVLIELAPTDRLRSDLRHLGKNSIEWRCEVSGDPFPVQIKGVRFDRAQSGWLARLTYERVGQPVEESTARVLTAARKREPVQLREGDLAVVFSLEPRSSRGSNGHSRIGWIKVFAQEGARFVNLASAPLDSSQNRRGERATYRGKNSGNPSAHGATRGVTYPQLLERKNVLDAQVRFIRTIKDPDRREEACELITRRIERAKAARTPSSRLEALFHAVSEGERTTLRALLKPERERLRSLRRAFDGGKRAYRNGVAMNVLRAFHDIRHGTSSPAWRGGSPGTPTKLNAVDRFRAKHPQGEVFLVIEDHKGRGPGTLRTGRMNRNLSVLGAAEIYRLIEEKGEFLKDPAAVAPVIPTGIRKDCPKCDHTHATGQSGRFCCANCGHTAFIAEVATANLLRRFAEGKR